MLHRRAELLRSVSLPIAIVVSIALAVPTTVAASKCASLKYKAVGAAALRRAKCKAKAVRRGEAVDPLCLAKADAKLAALFTRAERHGDCLTTDDEADLRMIADTFISQAMSALEPPPPAVACCAIGGGLCILAPISVIQNCIDVGGTPGAPGDVCDAGTGTCQPPPSTLGPCCEAGTCYSGPGVDSAGCFELVGTFFPSSFCLADQSCSAP